MDDPLPIETLRDLLGITRALWLAWRDEANPIELDELRAIGHQLSEAIKLARQAPAPSMGHRAARRRAENATRRLCDLIGNNMALLPVVQAVCARIVEPVPTQIKLRDEDKREYRRKRG